MTWRSQTRHVTTIAYRLEDEKGEMPLDDVGMMTAYTNPATFANGIYAKYLKKDEYAIYEYIIDIPSTQVSDSGEVRFNLWNALSKTRVY